MPDSALRAPVRDTSDLRPVSCEAEGCSVTLPLRDCHSFIASMKHVHRTEGVYRQFQCEAEQHFACCHEHAKAAVLTCIHEHHSADDLVPHAIPNPEKMIPVYLTHCAIASCPTALTEDCYSVPLAYAMPGPGYTAYICDPEAEHWACSELHAKQAAAACLEEHLETGDHA